MIVPTEDELRRLDECVREPIRTPGSIQPHGALLAVDPRTLVIMYASDNCAAILGIDARLLLGRPLGAITGDSWADIHLDSRTKSSTDGNPHRFEIGAKRFEVIVHHDGPLSIVEFEPVEAEYGDRTAVQAHQLRARHDLLVPPRRAR